MDLIGIQTEVAWEDPETNHARVRELLGGARIAPESLLVLPEMFATGFSMETARVAERRRETEFFLMDLARQYQSYVIGGMASIRVAEQGEYAVNEAVVVSRSGEVLGRYEKMHPFSLVSEQEHYTAGKSVRVFACGALQVAPTICYDLRFPELYRSAIDAGAELLVVIANWPAVRVDHWITLLQARAIENQAYVIGVNRVGQDPSQTYPGKSLIVDPRGKILAEGGGGSMLVRAAVDRATLQDWRAGFPALKDRRQEFGCGASSFEKQKFFQPPE